MILYGKKIETKRSISLLNIYFIANLSQLVYSISTSLISLLNIYFIANLSHVTWIICILLNPMRFLNPMTWIICVLFNPMRFLKLFTLPLKGKYTFNPRNGARSQDPSGQER